MAAEKNFTLNIEGMTCAHCAMTVTKVLQNSGAEHPNVNIVSGEATFRLSDPTKLQKIVSGISKAGYKVVKSEDASAHKHHAASAAEKRFLFTLPFTAVLFFSHMLLPHDFILNEPYVQLALCIPVFIAGCVHFGKSAWNSLKVGVPNMDVLITMGSGAAFVYSVAGILLYYGSHEVHNYIFFETTATIITLVLLGNVMEQRSVKRTTSAIRELGKLQTSAAKKIVLENGKEWVREIPAAEVLVGDILQVNAGDKIPVDGSVISGNVSVDESMITGESVPVERLKGGKVIGGTVAVNGNMRMLAEKVGKEMVLSKIIEMVKAAQQAKPSIQKLGDKVSNIFVPVVVVISMLTFLTCYFAFDIPVQKSLLNSVAVLVISCPCAMGLATPTAIMVGIGRAAKNGILIKGGSTLEEFARTKRVVFDKTGTLTTGKFLIKNIQPVDGVSAEELESVLYQLEQRSSHPIAKSIVAELKARKITPVDFAEVNEIKGVGMEARTRDGNIYKVGSKRIAEEISENGAHSVYLVRNGKLAGYVDLQDEIKLNARGTVKFLKERGITPVLVSGDRKSRCEEIARELGIEQVHSEQLPQQKLELVSSFSLQERTAMVGDGINDAPALAKASVGVSIGNATQVAIQSAQIILLNEKDLSQLTTAFLISRHTLITIKQNLFWAFFYNVIAIPVAAAGFLSPTVAALAMAFSDVIVVGNSIRLRTKRLN